MSSGRNAEGEVENYLCFWKTAVLTYTPLISWGLSKLFKLTWVQF